jgi:type IV secretory pathway protease TraF
MRRRGRSWLLTGILLGLGGTGVCLVLLACSRKHLLLNIGQSLAPSLFLCAPVHPREGLAVEMFVQFTPPARVVAELARVAPALRTRVPWVKRIAAVETTQVCWDSEAVHLDGRVALPLPLLHTYALRPQHGCRTLIHDEVLVVGTHAHSYDGRYFGPLTRDELTAICHPLLPWERPS